MNDEFFWSCVDIKEPNECWPWTALRYNSGYGRYGRVPDHANFLSHRYAWALTNGRLPIKGEVIMHACDNPPCVNPNHLCLGTQKENIIDMYSKGRGVSNARKGDKQHMAKLTWERVRQMRKLELVFTQQMIGDLFGVTQTTARAVLKHESWKE